MFDACKFRFKEGNGSKESKKSNKRKPGIFGTAFLSLDGASNKASADLFGFIHLDNIETGVH